MTCARRSTAGAQGGRLRQPYRAAPTEQTAGAPGHVSGRALSDPARSSVSGVAGSVPPGGIFASLDAVPVTLRHELAAARGRGTGFATAWEVALTRALRVADSPLQRDEWSACLLETAGAWRAAYQDQPATALAVAAATMATAA